MKRIFRYATVTLAAVALLLLYAPGAAASSMLYIYELPDGTRIVTDYVLSNKHYRLVRTGYNPFGVGHLSVSKDSQFFRVDATAYDDLIRRIAAEHEVDFALVKAIIHAESAFNPYAKSTKGALGLMQVLPETARRHGVEDVHDPARNIEAGVRYIKHLSRLFNNRNHLVIAAYNAGENAVIRHRGIPPYPETQLYVRKVLRFKREYAKS